MKRLATILAATGMMTSVAFADHHTGTITASLVVQGECEVLVTNIGATTENFVAAGTNVNLVQSTSLDPTNFDNAPTGTTINADTTLAVMCSASDALNHTLTMTSGGATLADTTDATNTVAWSPVYALQSTPGTTAAIETTGTNTALTASATATTLHEYIISATVAANDVAGLIPATYTQTIAVTVSYAP